MKKIVKFVVIPVASLVFIGGCTAVVASNSSVVESARSTLEITATPTTPTTVTTPAATISTITYTKEQENAIRMAEQYLDYTAFSRKGLIEQLMFEGFSEPDATFALDELEPYVNWNEKAMIKGQSYLDFKPFSRQGLIDQLVFEGFTKDQAIFAVDNLGL